jgi:hypothetical protein
MTAAPDAMMIDIRTDHPAATTEMTNPRVVTVVAAHATLTPAAASPATEHAVRRLLARSGGETASANVPVLEVPAVSARDRLYVAVTVRALGALRTLIAMSPVVAAVAVLRVVVHESRAKIVGTASASAMTVVLLANETIAVIVRAVTGRETMTAGMGVGNVAVDVSSRIAINLVVRRLLLMVRIRRESVIVTVIVIVRLGRGVESGVWSERGVGIGDGMIGIGVGGGVARGAVVGIVVVDAVLWGVFLSKDVWLLVGIYLMYDGQRFSWPCLFLFVI